MIKMILATFWLAVIPAFAGIPFTGKKKPEFSDVFLSGYLILFTVMELLTLPMLAMKMPLHVLTAVYGVMGIGLAVFGILFFWKKQRKNFSRSEKKERPGLFFWAAVFLILLQVAMCAVLAHMDADDCFYVATATTDVYTDTIFEVDPYTGGPYSVLPSRYVLSPFPVFLAVVSQLSGGLHPAIMAHMLFPVFFLPLAYMVQYRFAKKWFPGEKNAQGIYLFLAACICSFSGYSVYNAGNFQMVRIWQGKAVLASVLLPYLIYLCILFLLEEKSEISWIPLLLANVSCCLLSSMGIILSPLLISCFLLLSLFMRRDWKRAAAGLLCCLPSIMLGIVYLFIS